MNWNYTVSTNTIWTSFDHGTVQADTREEALKLAKLELHENFDIANKALEKCPKALAMGMNISFEEDEIQIEEGHGLF